MDGVITSKLREFLHAHAEDMQRNCNSYELIYSKLCCSQITISFLSLKIAWKFCSNKYRHNNKTRNQHKNNISDRHNKRQTNMTTKHQTHKKQYVKLTQQKVKLTQSSTVRFEVS
jgi:hypothetical protein